MTVKKYKQLIRSIAPIQIWAYVQIHEEEGERIRLNKTQALALVAKYVQNDTILAKYWINSEWYEAPKDYLGTLTRPVILVN